MPSQAVIGGELQPDLSVDVRRRFASAAHDQRELDHVGRADLHGLCFHIADTGGRAVIAWKTEQIFTLSFQTAPERDFNALLIAEIFFSFALNTKAIFYLSAGLAEVFLCFFVLESWCQVRL